MIPSARAAALRSTAMTTTLALAVGLAAWATDAAAKSKIPLPKPRPIARKSRRRTPDQASLKALEALAESKALAISLTTSQAAQENLLRERTVKEVLHELGHTFGLVHCSEPSCAMSLATHIELVDAKTEQYCARCGLQLVHRFAAQEEKV